MSRDLLDNAKKIAEYCNKQEKIRNTELIKINTLNIEKNQKTELNKSWYKHYEKSYKKTDPFWGDKIEATIIWLIAIFVGSIFNDRIGIWIFATIIWFNYVIKH